MEHCKNKYRLFIGIIMVAFLGFLNENVMGELSSDSNNFKNIMLIGWDSVQRNHLRELLNEGKLKFLKSIIDNGIYVDIIVAKSKTRTKACWAKMLTGYNPEITGVYTNKNYKPIPKGYTIFEKLKSHFGDGSITTLLLGGVKHNLGIRGPHRICMNCGTGFQHLWWDEELAIAANPNEKKVLKDMEGEPYFNAYRSQAIDIYDAGLGEGSNVGQKVLEYLEKIKDDRFFLFVQFYDPNIAGHLYGENSGEYSDAIILADEWLGKIISKLKESDIYNDTLIYVASNHGFEEGGRHHRYKSEETWLVTNDQIVSKKEGELNDIPATILKRFGLNLEEIKPKLLGDSLF